ncbi:hypothetical protein FRX31_011498 [Thalictrum thalictroides]|uniref:Uncharacterized protein n=1 Tax=Thalictrum thalictroides TaxID=46969 RepID=A0A7J6WR26_THATH|nr:hypothetical protein FRX31_011498 [Thalictrum thalictroides]
MTRKRIASVASDAGVKRRVTYIISRVYRAVERSMCTIHFDRFDSFHVKLNEVGWIVARADIEM